MKPVWRSHFVDEYHTNNKVKAYGKTEGKYQALASISFAQNQKWDVAKDKREFEADKYLR